MGQVQRIALAIAIAVIPLAPAWSQGASVSIVSEPKEEDLRILEVVLEETVLTDALVAYAGPSGGTLLPLQATSELLAIAISTTPSDGLASGFILNERRTFHLDVGRRQVTIAGRQRSFEPSLVHVHRDNIYVDSSLLGEWFPVAFDIDLFALRVRIRPREPLPLQLRLERERRIRHWRLMLPPPDPGFARQRTAYKLWETPFVDQTLRFSVGGATTASFATYATGDLLFMESETYLAGGDDDFFDASRITLRRRDPAAALGGGLGATEIALGHVIHPSSGLLSVTSEPLPGFLVTNLPLNRPIEFDRHAFSGNLPPGWDVELYHNGSLIDYQQSRADGQYLFTNVPVLFGMNFFRLVFYGPQGQQRVEEHRFLLGESLTLPGRFDYRVTGNIESGSRRRVSALGSYGISRNLTVTAEGALLPMPTDERRYGKLGLRAFWSALFAYGDFVQDDQGGRAWEAGMQTRVLGANLLVSRQSLNGGFISEVFSNPGDPLTARDRVRLDTAIPAWLLPRIPVNVELERQHFSSGLTRTTAQNRISAYYKGLAFTNRALWTSVSGQPSTFEAGLQVSRHIRGLGIRGELLYRLTPASFTTANLTLERSLGSGYRVHANVSRSFLAASHVYSVGIDKTTGSFAAGVNAIRDAQGNATANFDLSAGFGRDPREGDWVPGARSRAAFGAVSARVFLDRNENGQFDAGDQPLPHVGFTINGIERAERTSDTGIAFLPEVSPHVSADVAVDVRTLEDPQWVPDLRGVRITPRPGKAVPIDVPVIATSEIEGMVETARGGGMQGVGGVTVEIVDTTGQVIQQTSTAFDGFYVLTHIRRGAYRVRVAQQSLNLPVSLSRAHLETAVTVTPLRPVITGIDFVIPHAGAPNPSAPVSLAERQPSRISEFRPDHSRETAPERPLSELSSEKRTADRAYLVQLGTFRIKANAERLARSVRDVVEDASIAAEGAYAVVRSGRRTQTEAIALARELGRRGIEALVIDASRGRILSANLAEGFVVQLGAFRSARNARDLARQIANRESIWRPTIEQRGRLHFVQTPPFPTRDLAQVAGEALRRLGFTSIVRQAQRP